jgi:hypothetical protein
MQGTRGVRLGVLLGSLLVGGCYNYLPLTSPTPEVGLRVSAELTRSGSDSLARLVGPAVEEMRGQVRANDENNILLSVAAVKNHAGIETLWRGEEVLIPRVTVLSLRERKFSLGQSLVLGGALLGASFVAYEAFKGGSAGGKATGGGGGRPN